MKFAKAICAVFMLPIMLFIKVSEVFFVRQVKTIVKK